MGTIHSRGPTIAQVTPSVTSDNSTPSLSRGALGTLDCVICYCPIDPTDRKSYMLAPCEHIFHKDCLVQWMDVKMECPTCRGDLPAI